MNAAEHQKHRNWISARRGVLVLIVFSATVLNVANARAVGDDTNTASPRQLYNDGTQKLRDGKLPEAEASLESAAASQNFAVQGPALYNLGEARFREGADALKKGPQPQSVDANSKRAADVGSNAIRSVDDALAGDDVQQMVSAYMQGRGARKDLKSATEAVQTAMGTFGKILTKWQRASGDFKSALELRPADLDAKTNAAVADRSIAWLVDQLQMMMQASQGMKEKRQELGKKMAALKGRLPKDEGEKLAGKGDDGDEDDDGKSKEPQPGDQEPGPKNGNEMLLTREEAARLLDMLKLDTNRKLAVGEGDTGKPKDHKGRDW